MRVWDELAAVLSRSWQQGSCSRIRPSGYRAAASTASPLPKPPTTTSTEIPKEEEWAGGFCRLRGPFVNQGAEVRSLAERPGFRSCPESLTAGGTTQPPVFWADGKCGRVKGWPWKPRAVPKWVVPALLRKERRREVPRAAKGQRALPHPPPVASPVARCTHSFWRPV